MIGRLRQSFGQRVHSGQARCRNELVAHRALPAGLWAPDPEVTVSRRRRINSDGDGITRECAHTRGYADPCGS